MGRYLTTDDEEIIQAFRPHPISWLPSYGSGLLWLAWGAAAWAVSAWLPVAWASHVGWAVFAMLALGHGLLRARRAKGRRPWVVHGPALGFVAVGWTLSAGGLLLQGPLAPFDPILVGAVLAAGSLIVRESERMVTRTYVTTQRIVSRRGLARRIETAVLYKDIDRVESEQRLLGTIFGFGRLRLVKKTRRRAKRTTRKGTEETEDDEVLELKGVPRFEEARRDVNTLAQEVRLSERERQKRLEERRLKQSMVQLTHWRPPRTP